MKLYISNSAEKCRNCFLNLSKFFILDVQQILGELNLDMSDKCNAFFVSKYILDLIKSQAKSKRLEGIIYINTNLSEKLFDNLFNCVKDLPKMENMVLIDDPIFQPLSDFYPLFEEVMFFPTVRKVRILECQTLKPFDDDNRKEESDTLRMLKEAKKRREILIKHK
ncbi:MAG: hypothetical protein ACI4TD_04415 [Phocaeicola sp.]